jgi:hypothetical protein
MLTIPEPDPIISVAVSDELALNVIEGEGITFIPATYGVTSVPGKYFYTHILSYAESSSLLEERCL